MEHQLDIRFFKQADLERNQKATVHRTGKLGFTAEAASKLRLSSQKSVDIGINQGNPEDKSLYVKFYLTEGLGAFKIIKAGNYYYVNTKPLFDTMKIDYIKENVVFDISKVENNDSLFCLKRRPTKNKTPQETEDES